MRKAPGAVRHRGLLYTCKAVAMQEKRLLYSLVTMGMIMGLRLVVL